MLWRSFLLVCAASWSELGNVTIPDVGSETMNYTLHGLKSGSFNYVKLFAVNTEGQSTNLNITFKTTDVPKLTERSIHEWKPVLYFYGGVILFVAVFVIIWFYRRRSRATPDGNVPLNASNENNVPITLRNQAQQYSDRNIYQNVRFRVHDTNNIFEDLTLNTQAVVNIDRHMTHTRQTAVNEFQEMIEVQQENNLVSVHQNTQENILIVSIHQNEQENIFVSVPQNEQENNLVSVHQNEQENIFVSVPQNQQELDLEQEGPFSEPGDYYNTLEIINRLEKIKVSELYDYVKDRTDETFRADFQKIPNALQMRCSVAQKAENIALNRYRAIIPYDHTRVYIDRQPDFFINASYIDGYEIPKAYIACLGPTAKTHDNFESFWEMVWHERSERVVMVTNLNETSGMKCEQYWPDESQDEMYGDILVSCQEIETFAEYTLRSFEITRTINADTFCRRLVHLQYTAWPDKKTPEDVTTIFEFRQKLKDVRTTMNGPVIVHCSAGIGSTGVFIAIDWLIMQGKKEGSVNVVACITKMREQRMKMVQTSEQFKFIFKVVTYALNFDYNPLPIENIKELIDMFGKRSFIRKYKELEMSLQRKSKEQIESIEKNMRQTDKNRQGADIPDDDHRVHLNLNRGFGDSDYINAVFINSYICKDHFIMAQSPLTGTESDFLSLIYQEKCFCVVSMDDFTESGMKIGKYQLKEEQSLDVGDFTVSCYICDSKPQYIVRKVTIKNKEEISAEERDFYHFQYKRWTVESDIPISAEEFVEFVKDVHEYETLGEESSHVLVHCLTANERSGIFCVNAIMIEKLLHDGHVSVMNTLRHLRTRRPSAITSMEQLEFCYKAAVVIAQSQYEGILTRVVQ